MAKFESSQEIGTYSTSYRLEVNVKLPYMPTDSDYQTIKKAISDLALIVNKYAKAPIAEKKEK